MTGKSAAVIPIHVSRNEWLDALEAAMTPETSEGKTAGELSDEAGISIKSLRPLIASLQREGRVECRKAIRIGIDGRRAQVPVYILLPKEQA
jgi:DNA-binding CsgD family transcriptional regulator